MKVNTVKNNLLMGKANVQQGFTLIELVIVVVILGFLAVTAIPKFIDLTDQAKQANIEGMAGGFATGVALTRAQWEAKGRPESNDINRIEYEGTNWVLTTPPLNNTTIRPGYPTGTAVGNSTGQNMNNARCLELWNGIYQQPPNITSSVADLNDATQSFDYLVDVDANGFCIYYLKETLNKNAADNFTNPNGDADIGNNFTYDATTSSVEVNIKAL